MTSSSNSVGTTSVPVSTSLTTSVVLSTESILPGTFGPNGSSSTSSKGSASSNSLTKFLVVLMLCVQAVLGSAVGQVSHGLAQVIQVDSLADALTNVTFNKENPNVKYLVAESGYMIENISYDDVHNGTEETANGTTLEKRWSCHSAPLGTHFTQRQTARQGNWHADWEPVSGCQDNNLGDGTLTLTFGTSYTYSVTESDNFDISLAASDGSSIGFGFSDSWSRSWGFSQTASYPVNVGQKCQVWSQHMMLWADQQTQRCDRVNYGSGGCHCGAWGPYIHGNLVGRSTDRDNYGLSCGEANIRC